MTDDLERYILDHIDREPDNLQRLDRDTHLRLLYPRMCSGHLQGRLLKMLVTMIAPRRVLELGTYSAYAARYPLFYRRKLLLPLLPAWRFLSALGNGRLKKELSLFRRKK